MLLIDMLLNILHFVTAATALSVGMAKKDAQEQVKSAPEYILAPGFSIELSSSDFSDLTADNYTYKPNNAADIPKLRDDVKTCEQWKYGTTNYFGSSDDAKNSWYSGIKDVAGSIFDQSKYHNCGAVSGAVAGGRMRYVYSATGRNCDTTSQQRTIEGSLDKAYREIILKDYNSVYCLVLTHQGTWSGYLLIGPNDVWPANLRCGKSKDGECVSGGINDNHT